MIRPTTAVLAAFLLAACGQGAAGADPSDPYAGLDAQILAWRADLEGGHPACANKVDGKGCDTFEVTCKAAQTITPEEQGRGVTAKLVAAMRFNGRTAEGGSGASGSAFAQFAKAGGQWTRTEAKPVNLTTCAPF